MNTQIRQLLLVCALIIGTTTYAQTEEIPLERKLHRIHTLNNGIYRLDFPRDYIRQTIVPETISNRENLAPHYPQTDHVFGEELDELLSDWIVAYPQEYDDYKNYLETYLRSFK